MEQNKVVVFALLVYNEGKLSASFNPPQMGFSKADAQTLANALVQSANELMKLGKEEPNADE